MKTPKLLVIIVILFGFLVSGCDKGTSPDTSYTYDIPPETGDGWETAHLNEVGLAAEPLMNLKDRLDDIDNHEIHSVLIVRDQKLVFEIYYPGHDYLWSGQNFHGDLVVFNRNTVHCTHSVTKSFASALVGIAMDQGHLENVDQKIYDFFPDYAAHRTPEKDEITIEHCLTMSAGLSWNEGESSLSSLTNDLILFTTSTDPIGFLLAKPLVYDPGTVFYYNGGLTNVLGQIVRRATDTRLDDFSGPNLFEPLGITQYEWLYLAGNITYCSGDLYVRPRDMAKFGQLFLDKGVWNGQRIISEDWIDASTFRHVNLPQASVPDGYGYQWWMDTFRRGSESYDSFYAAGWGGQYIFVIPELNMVCVFTGANYNRQPPLSPQRIITEYILDALDE